MSTLLTPDICVIGGGTGGLTVALAAAMLGTPVVLVEKGAMGGRHLNRGSLPSQSLIAAARLAHGMRSAPPFGIAPGEPEVDFAAVARHIREVTAAVAPNSSAERLSVLGVQVIRAAARFTDKHTVVAGDHQIRARRFVVATGSSPLVPAIPGLETIDYLTSETVFSLARKPGHLAILGGGRTGCELAQAYRRLGCDVTVVEPERLLAHEDQELAGFALRALRAEGIDLREGTRVVGATRRGRNGVRLSLMRGETAETLDATHLVIAAGRKPNIEGLGLESARIRHDGTGIQVGAKLRTSNRKVYAVGDVAGQGGSAHLAAYQGGLVLRPLLFRLPGRTRPRIVPRMTFTDPEIAHVGLTEAEARSAGERPTILRWPHSENDRAQAERTTAGLTKLVIGRRGRILGAGIAGRSAGEAIHVFALAAARGLRVADVAGYVAPYPTFADAGNRAAGLLLAASIARPAVRGLVRLLRRFG
ncbi:MAG: FAD-dependent oxidoreductase [Rhizobiaceae bacterium]|nr:FAD-dependent oxidoreductase [Rhizobiaceae bacterium]